MGSPGAPEVVVIGSGLAGLVCTRDLAHAGFSVTVVTAARAGCDGASHRVHALAPWIMLSAPRARGDSPSAFLADLERRSEGLARPDLTEALASSARDASEEIVRTLDLRPVGEPVAMPGDAWPRGLPCLPARGGPLLAPLLAEVRSAGVRIRERTLGVGLGFAGERLYSVVVLDRRSGKVEELAADAAVLACGGIGAVFPLTTAPRWCRGSGLALASAAGILVHRPELTQALPVTTGPAPYFPTTAVVLGGELIVDGEVHAPVSDLREVTEVIASALREGRAVSLRLPTGVAPSLPVRLLDDAGAREAGTVRLTIAVHHAIGGVAIDSWGRTSAPGVYACGEAAGGVQGARRTMGTGLLEAWVFGRRVARAVARDVPRLEPVSEPSRRRTPPWPKEANSVEARLDDVLGPLAVVRPPEEVGRASDALAALAGTASELTDAESALAGLRLAAARTILAGELERGQRILRVGAGSGPARRSGAEEPWPKRT